MAKIPTIVERLSPLECALYVEFVNELGASCYCEHGHDSCARQEGGPCSNEAEAKAFSYGYTYDDSGNLIRHLPRIDQSWDDSGDREMSPVQDEMGRVSRRVQP
jgi:YD repeat-containing protein